jgi:HAD superfamily hydrolase (TIGR01549 family)
VIEAVTFDFWDTLMRAPSPREAREGRLRRLRGVLDVSGTTVSDEQIGGALDEIIRVFNERWNENVQFTSEHGTVLLVELLDLVVDDDLLDRLATAFQGTGQIATPEMNPNVKPTLERLRSSGLRVGIICDVGMAPSTILRGHLVTHEIVDLFDHWSFSDDVGHYKPAPEIFEHALGGLGGVDPGSAAHVGDLRRTDVAGALAMGMTAVRYRGRNDDQGGPGDPEAHHVIDDHAQLLDVLGL